MNRQHFESRFSAIENWAKWKEKNNNRRPVPSLGLLRAVNWYQFFFVLMIEVAHEICMRALFSPSIYWGLLPFSSHEIYTVRVASFSHLHNNCSVACVCISLFLNARAHTRQRKRVVRSAASIFFISLLFPTFVNELICNSNMWSVGEKKCVNCNIESVAASVSVFQCCRYTATFIRCDIVANDLLLCMWLEIFHPPRTYNPSAIYLAI